MEVEDCTICVLCICISWYWESGTTEFRADTMGSSRVDGHRIG